jgi:hypothetical protein
LNSQTKPEYSKHFFLANELRSYFVTDTWFEYINEPTLVDAILDRLLQQAHRIEIKGESMRKRKKLQENNCNNYIYEPLFKYHSRGTLSCDSVVHFGRIIQVVSEMARNKRAYFWNDKAAIGL